MRNEKIVIVSILMIASGGRNGKIIVIKVIAIEGEKKWKDHSYHSDHK